METVKKRDWGLIVAGILLILCGGFFAFAPGLTLVTMTAFAGAAFLVSGVFDVISYIRFHNTADLSGWTLAYAILDIVVGLMFLLHPLALAGVIPWVIGLFFVIFGVFEIVGAIKIKGSGAKIWGWMLFSGIVSALCGVSFFILPASFVIFMAVFVIMRGISLIIYGFSTSTMKLA
ncbi:MAG: DUF308 domain-containing protein [Raoultibacter sp.]